MTQINSYLTFGNCREAMNFYKECLGGQLNLQPIGEPPNGRQAAERDEGVHSTFGIKTG